MGFWHIFNNKRLGLAILCLVPAFAFGIDRIDYSGVRYDLTPQTYVGLDYADRFSGVEYTTDTYFFPPLIPLHHWGLYGNWNMDRDKLVSIHPHALIRFNFKAQKVYLDMGSTTGAPIEVTLLLNNEVLGNSAGKDAPTGMLIVNKRAVYELVDQGGFEEGLLEIHDRDPGLAVYGFSFE